jgi:CheY-like chemotaxis protein
MRNIFELITKFPKGHRLSNYKVLIVDDERVVRDTIQRWFTLRGFEVDLANNGAEGVAKAIDGAYHAIIMDLEMPTMGGIEATKMIVDGAEDAIIIAITGYSENPQAVIDAGAKRVLLKPLKLNELEETVLQFIE